MRSTLEQLISIHSPTGFEEKITKCIVDIHSQQAIDTDFMGNVTIKIPNVGAKKVLVLCSIDEPSLVVNHIDSNGFIRFYPSGKLKTSDVLNAQVTFPSGITGFIGCEKRSYSETKMGFDNLFIDIGVMNKNRALEYVNIGDHPSFNIPTRIKDNSILGRGDCKVPASIVSSLARDIGQTQNNLIFSFTSQGQLGSRGSLTVINRENPDLLIHISTIDSTDTPNHNRKGKIEIGSGPVLVVEGSSVFRHHTTNHIIQDVARSSNVPLQLAVDDEYRHDEFMMNLSQASVPMATLSIPMRKYGCFGAISDVRDSLDACKLLIKTLRKKLF